MYEIGRVYVWQNLVDAPHMNGVECVVTGPLKEWNCAGGGIFMCQETDSIDPHDGEGMLAQPGDLRPKNPPTGEQKIRSMFEPKPVMEVA